MKYLFALFLLAAAVAIFSCSKGSTAADTPAAPAILTFTATPATDSSGNVTFEATATNATTFRV